MMTEYSYFLEIISDHIFKRKTAEPISFIDWNLLTQLAHKHQLDGILFFQCKSFLPDEFRTILEERFGTSLFLSANREKMVSEIYDVLNSEHIDYFVIKGSAVAFYYPFPALRTMVDTDLVVHTEDRQHVHEIFLSLGFVNESKNGEREWVYWKNQMEFELHDHLIYEETINRKSHEEFFNNFWEYVENNVIDCNFHILFLLVHLRKHLMNCGVGFRQFMDIAVITMNDKKLDWIWIEDQLIRLDMMEFAKTVFSLNEAWFGVNSPIRRKNINETFYENATEQVFNNGVFGFNNEENKNNAVVNNVRECDNAKLAMLQNATRKVFPSYKTLITIPKYDFLKGKKWLLPVAWFYRLFNGIKNKRAKIGFQCVKSSFISNEVVEKRSEWLEQWGL